MDNFLGNIWERRIATTLDLFAVATGNGTPSISHALGDGIGDNTNIMGSGVSKEMSITSTIAGLLDSNKYNRKLEEIGTNSCYTTWEFQLRAKNRFGWGPLSENVTSCTLLHC